MLIIVFLLAARCFEFHKHSKPRVRFSRPYVPSSATKPMNRGSYREVQYIQAPQSVSNLEIEIWVFMFVIENLSCLLNESTQFAFTYLKNKVVNFVRNKKIMNWEFYCFKSFELNGFLCL